MISICTTSINGKNEMRTFVEALVQHNPDVEFEICATLDNRVNDGSPEVFAALARKHPQFRYVEVTEDDVLHYLSRLVKWYATNGIFPQPFREHLLDRFHEFDAHGLPSSNEDYLWLALGFFYNQAIDMARGDILVVIPSDYIWTASLRMLESYVINYRQDGIFYGKLDGLRCPVSNEPKAVLEHAVNHMALPHPDGICRQYLRCPSALEDHYLVDFWNKKVTSLAEPNYRDVFIDLCRQLQSDGTWYNKMHHGTHVMTRKMMDVIGGFTEEFYGRAWPDDKMNAHAMRLFWKDCSSLPLEFAFHWISKVRWGAGLSGTDPEKISQHEILSRDKYAFSHPIQGRTYAQRFLHDGFSDTEYTRNVNGQLDKEFAVGPLRGREAPIIRFSNRGVKNR